MYFFYQHHARKHPVAHYSGQNNSCRTFIRVRCFLRTCQALKWERKGRIFTSCLVLTGQLAINLHGQEMCDLNIYYPYYIDRKSASPQCHKKLDTTLTYILIPSHLPIDPIPLSNCQPLSHACLRGGNVLITYVMTVNQSKLATDL